MSSVPAQGQGGEYTIDINDGARKLKLAGGKTLIASLKEKGIFMPSACGGRGRCGLCRCTVLEGAGEPTAQELAKLPEAERAKGVRLACQVMVERNLRIQVPEKLLTIRAHACKVERIVKLTHDILGLTFRLPEGHSISFKAGQYVQFAVPDSAGPGAGAYRAYSIASNPADTSVLDLVVRRVPNGIVTSYIFDQLKEGDTIQLEGPYGDFYLRESGHDIVFIAGGSGLAPIKGMVDDMVKRGITNRKASFFFGAQGVRDLYYVDYFKDIAAQHPWFSFVPALSHPGPEGAQGWETGLITEVVCRHYDKLDNHEAYLCGSPGMIDASIIVLKSKGMPEGQVFYDKF